MPMEEINEKTTPFLWHIVTQIQHVSLMWNQAHTEQSHSVNLVSFS